MIMPEGEAQSEREAAHRWLDVSSAGAAVASAGLFVAGSYVTSPTILAAATAVGLVGILGRLTFLRETEPPAPPARNSVHPRVR
jgi:hypothetical protein